MNNPFADYGGIVTGDRFIGRKNELTAIQNRLLGQSFGNLAIMGLPRIGKSSLAYNALMTGRDVLVQKKIIPLRINMGDVNSAENFFSKMIYDLDDDLTAVEDLVKENLKAVTQRLSTENSYGIERNRLIKEYFKTLKQAQFRIIYILDEFDAVRKYFKLHDFQFLRELSYNPDTKIGLLTVSRRALKEIEPENGAISNFYQIFTDLYLGMYDDLDLNEYWQRFFNGHLKITETDKKKIYQIAGRHPFLLDLFNFHLLNNFQDDISRAIESTKKSIQLTILNNYKTIIDLLKEENLDSKLLQMAIGPVYDITITEAEKIERYQLVKIENNIYKAFSEDFHTYLNLIRREIRIWYLWHETELKLRKIVRQYLEEKFGENWLSGFLKKNPKKTFLFDGREKTTGLIERQKLEESAFKERASTNLLDFTYPQELFDGFIVTDWTWFKQIFHKQPIDWKPKFDLLAKIRNPLAHNKENILRDFERNSATAYCQEIIEKIDGWYEGK